MAKFCPNCGNPLEEDSVFCDNCGTKLGSAPAAQQPAAQAPQPQYQPPVQQYPQYQPPMQAQYPQQPAQPQYPPQYPQQYPQEPRKKTGLIVGLIVGGVVLIAAIVVAVLLLTKDKAPEDPTRPTEMTAAVTERPTRPTEAPTEAPTEPPTEAPTEAPTEPPTEPPTEAPTEPPTEAPLPYENDLTALRAEDFKWISDAQSGSLTGSFLSNDDLLGRWKGEFIHDGVWELVYVTIARDATVTIEPYQKYGNGWEDNSGAPVRTFRCSFDVSCVYGSGDAGDISLYTFLVYNGIQYGVGTCGGGNLYLTRP